MEIAYRSRPVSLLPQLVRGGAAVWLLLLLFLPAPTATRLFLVAPLVLLPVLLSALPDRPLAGGIDARGLAAWSFISAGPLAVALSLPAGPNAAALASGWILVTALCGLAAARHGLLELPGLFRPGRVSDLATDASLGFLAVGGLFLLADRLGLAVMGYGPPYTLMGAIHYTFLGGGLVGLVALMSRRHARLRHWPAALGLIGGVTVTAAGLIAGSALLNWIGVALLVGVGGVAVLWSLLAEAAAAGGHRRAMLLAVVAALAAGMSMGLLWASATLFGFAFVGLETMVRTHGVLNALGVVGGVLLLGLAQPAETGR